MSTFYAVWDFLYCFVELFAVWRLMSSIFLISSTIRKDWKDILCLMPLGFLQGVNARSGMMSIAILYISIVYMTVFFMKRTNVDKKDALVVAVAVYSSFYLFRLATIHLAGFMFDLDGLGVHIYAGLSRERFLVLIFHMLSLGTVSFCLIRHFEKIPFDMDCWRWTLILVSITENLAIIYFQGIFTHYQWKDTLQDILLLSFVLHILATIILAKFQWRYQKMRQAAADIRNEELLDKYRQLENLHKEQAVVIHDMKNYLLVLNNALQMDNRKTAADLLPKILQAVPDMEMKTYTGHNVIDWLFRAKAEEARRDNVRINIDGSKVGDIELTDLEVCTLLGNLLDNALEAARKSADKWVNAAIWRERDLLILTVENSLAVLPRQNGSLFFTSKPDKRHHGIGLRNVERVVRKYDGRLKFQVNPKHFRVEAILNVKRR